MVAPQQVLHLAAKFQCGAVSCCGIIDSGFLKTALSLSTAKQALTSAPCAADRHWSAFVHSDAEVVAQQHLHLAAEPHFAGFLRMNTCSLLFSSQA